MAKKELKQPDPFLRFSIELWDKVAAHAKEIGIALGLVVVAGLVYAAVQAHQSSARAQAGGALAEALKVASRPVKGDASDEEKPETPPAPEDAPFKTFDDKQKAIIAALQEVVAKYPGSDAARTALVPLGDANLQLGQLDAAQKAYSDFVAAGGNDAQLRALAELGLAKVAEARKDWNGAQAAYDQLQRDAPHVFLKDVAALGKARMLELAGKKQDAAAAFAAVRDGYAGTDASRQAGEHLAMLESQGFKAPAGATVRPGSDGGFVFNGSAKAE